MKNRVLSKYMFNNYLKFSFSSKKLQSPCLTRDFIYDRLYNSDSGYFCKDDIQIGELDTPINFKECIGFDDYQKEVFTKYPKNAWLTPSELFRPYYGMTIGNYMHQVCELKLKEYHEHLQRKVDTASYKNYQNEYMDTQQKMMLIGDVIQKPPLRIIEVGAGAGGNAESILSFFKNYELKYYDNLEYHIYEISPQMCKKLEFKLSQSHPKLFQRGQIKIFNEDIMNYKNTNFSTKSVSQQNKNLQQQFTKLRDEVFPIFVIFLEVFDNMPHDRVYYDQNKKDWLYQAMVEFDQSTDPDANTTIKEIKVPIQDPLIQEVLNIYKSMPQNDLIEEERLEGGLTNKIYRMLYQIKDQKNLFLPTFSYKMLKSVTQQIKNHHLIVADFDILRGAKSAVQGLNAPIVSKKLEKSHQKIDYDTYLVQRGSADIFFPTDFRLLRQMYKKVTDKKCQLLKTYQFMEEFSKSKWTETQSGYNPLKEDFLNTSFLVTKDE